MSDQSPETKHQAPAPVGDDPPRIRIDRDTLVPVQTLNEAGKRRRVGVEIELGGLGIDRTVEVVAAHSGGEAVRDTDYVARVRTAQLGELRVEVDFELLKRMGHERSEAGEAQPGVPEELLAAIAKDLVPCEVVTPPIDFEALPALDALCAALRSAGATGTDEGWLNAFGVHFNPETPGLGADTVLAYMRAFALLHDWLNRELEVDLTRRLTPYIQPFPADYVKLVTASDYDPDLDRLIDDYLSHNPTRNRALDMLPLFSHLDRERVCSVVDDSRVNPRPTFHYRLPNSRLGDPEWSVTREWRHWLALEALADDQAALGELCVRYHDFLSRPLPAVLDSWRDTVDAWVEVG